MVHQENSQHQCVAMSVCALIYHSIKGISNPGHLKQVICILEVNVKVVCYK